MKGSAEMSMVALWIGTREMPAFSKGHSRSLRLLVSENMCAAVQLWLGQSCPAPASELEPPTINQNMWFKQNTFILVKKEGKIPMEREQTNHKADRSCIYHWFMPGLVISGRVITTQAQNKILDTKDAVIRQHFWTNTLVHLRWCHDGVQLETNFLHVKFPQSRGGLYVYDPIIWIASRRHANYTAKLYGDGGMWYRPLLECHWIPQMEQVSATKLHLTRHHQNNP
jgi:hypothetical protein